MFSLVNTAATGDRLPKPLVELVFVLFDLDGGTLTLYIFTVFHCAPLEYCTLMFFYQSDGHLSREEFLSVLHDRLHSNDTHATGSKNAAKKEENEKV